MAEWIDLIDPTPDEVRAKLPRTLQEPALDLLLAPSQHADESRPTLQSHGDYVFGIFLVAVAVPEEDRLFYQEIDIVLTHDVLLTVSKTPEGEQPFHPRGVPTGRQRRDDALPACQRHRGALPRPRRRPRRGDRPARGQRRDCTGGAGPEPSERAPPRPPPHPANACADSRCRSQGGRQRRRGFVRS